MRFLVVFGILFCFTGVLCAQTFGYNNCNYSILSDTTVSLVTYQKNGKNIGQEVLTLDSVVVYKKKKYKVEKIERSAFECEFPKTAFHLHGVKQLCLPQTLSEIDSNVFYGYFNSLQSVTLPDGLTFIGSNAFANLPSLTEVNVKGVTRIGDWSFSLNPSLSQVALDTCVQVIGHNSFFNCSRLKNINLHNVRYIEDHAFKGTAIESLYIPHCKIIGEFAFADCRMINSISFSDKLQLISDFAFHNSSSLRRLCVPSGKIGEGAFMGCTSLNKVELSDAIESIGQAAFFGCSALNSIHIPKFITRIEAMTFMDCINLKSITLPNTLTLIGESAFAGSGLEEIVIPASVLEIQDNAFSNCIALKKVVMQGGKIKIGENVFPENVNIVWTKQCE